MIGRREKTKRSSVKNMESVFLTQVFFNVLLWQPGAAEPDLNLKFKSRNHLRDSSDFRSLPRYCLFCYI